MNKKSNPLLRNEITGPSIADVVRGYQPTGPSIADVVQGYPSLRRPTTPASTPTAGSGLGRQRIRTRY